MGRMITEKPLKFVGRFLLNAVYGVAIFLSVLLSSSVLKEFIPREYYIVKKAVMGTVHV